MTTKLVWRSNQYGSSGLGASVATLASDDSALVLSVDVLRPQLGAGDIRFRGAPLSGWRLLAALRSESDWCLPLADSYVRGADLIATYEPQGGQQVCPQIYWRFLSRSGPSRPRQGLELIVSVQTDLLHSEPGMAIASDLSDGEIWRLERDHESGFALVDSTLEAMDCTQADCLSVFVIRPFGNGFSYVQMVHPSDVHHTTISSERHAAPHGVRIVHDLFPDPLEKGVIRRGRVRGWFVDRDDDLRAAVECYRHWLDEPPPLTT
jgi:hypothetical protein